MEDFIESVAPPSVKVEESGAVCARITGTFLSRNALSANGRFYPAATVDRMVEQAQKRLSDKRARPIQMLAQHASAERDATLEVVGRVTRVGMNGDQVFYEGEIANTAAGRDVANLLQGGFHNGVSLRAKRDTPRISPGMYQGKAVQVVDFFETDGLDFTLRPGLEHDAWVNTVQLNESIDPSLVTSVTPGAVRDDGTLSPAAGSARQWYNFVTEGVENNLITVSQLEETVKEWLPIWEKTFQQPGHYTTKDRAKIKHFAGPHKSFPIVTQQDVYDAAKLHGHAANPGAVKAKIAEIAHQLGYKLPDDWQENKDSTDDDEDDDDDEGQESEGSAENSGGLTEGVPMDWQPCDACRGGREDDCTCPGCQKHEGCWCCARINSVSGAAVAPHPDRHHGNTKESSQEATTMTEEEVRTLVASLLAEQAKGSPPPTTEALEALPAVYAAIDSLENALNGLTEAKVDYSAGVTNAKMAALHNHIAGMLGYSCADGGVPVDVDQNAIADTKPNGPHMKPQGAGGVEQPGYGTGARESAPWDAAGIAHLIETIGRQSSAGQHAQPVQGFTTELRAYEPKLDPNVTALAESIKLLGEAVKETQLQVAGLTESIPDNAAKAAVDALEKSNWRQKPGRSSQLVENDDAGSPGGGDPEADLMAMAADRSIPVEQRMHRINKLLQNAMVSEAEAAGV